MTPELFVTIYALLFLWCTLIVARDLYRRRFRAKTLVYAFLAYFFGVITLAAGLQ